MSEFNVGDRVEMIELQSKYTGKTGTVKGFRTAPYTGKTELTIHFDCNNKDHFCYFPPEYFIHVKEKKTIQQEREDYAGNYAEWFAHVYTNISMAGGDPISFIEKLPNSVIDTMVRNHLYVMYRGPMEGTE